MKKTILATAIAAAVMAAPMTAAANVVIYGKIHASIDYVDADGDEFMRHDDNSEYDVFDGVGTWAVTDRTSRIGFKGSEDLGNGLKAIWKVEIGYNLDGTSRRTSVVGGGYTDYDYHNHGYNDRYTTPVGTTRTTSVVDEHSHTVDDAHTAPAVRDVYTDGDSHSHDVHIEGDGTLDGGGWGVGRNSYIGLAGDWGTVLIGKHDTPLKISTGRLDVFVDTMADYNSTVGFTDRRAGNVIAYISPNWNGFTFAVAGVAAEDFSQDTDIGDGGYSIAAMYFNNGFYASLAWEDVSGISPFDTNEVSRVGLGYIMNAFTLGLVYEHEEIGQDYWGSDDEYDKWMISGAYDFGNNTVKAMYGNLDFSDGYYDDDYDAWAIGWDHKLSVRTKVYALYADSELGLHNHPSTQIGNGNNGGNGFSMGMVHTF